MSAAPDGLLYYDPARQPDLPARLGMGWQAREAGPGAAAGQEAGRQLHRLGLAADDLPVLLLLAPDAWGALGGAGSAGGPDGAGDAGGATTAGGAAGIGGRRLRLLGMRLGADEVAGLSTGGGFSAGPAGRVVVYGSLACSDCRRARRLLDDAGVSYGEVDLDRDPQAEALVVRRSGGRRVVPTLLFDHRLWAFNPDPPLLRRLLRGARVGAAAGGG